MLDRRYIGSVAIINVGKMVSGDFFKGILDADAILVRDGVIDQIGWSKDFDLSSVDHVIDVQNQVLCPGFIDLHVHNTIDDFQSMAQALNWMESYLWYGITTIVSEGEQGPGYPRFFNDPIGTKATAIVARRVFDNFRPGGFQKFHGGALVLVDGLTEADFAEMSKAGVWLVAEIGGGGLYQVKDVQPMIAWARKYNFKVSVHVGPQSIPGSSLVGSELCLAIQPDKLAHLNGGSTAAPWTEIKACIDGTRSYIEMISMGNQKMADRIFSYLKERNELHRVVFGSDTPTGQGVMPNCIQRMVMRAAAFNDIPPEQAIAMGTGNSADLMGFNRGKIEVGREADLLALDSGYDGAGEDALEAMKLDDTFGVSMVMVDGQVVSVKGRDGRPTKRCILIDGKPTYIDNINEYLFGPYFPGYLH
jgi:enamidase